MQHFKTKSIPWQVIRFTLILILLSVSICFSQTKVAAVKTNKGWGYIREDGSWLVPPTFDRFWQDRQYIVGEDSRERVLCEFHDGMASIRISDKWGFIDTSGKEVILHQYKDVRDFRESAAVVVLWKGDWTYINKKGELLFEQYFDEARSFSNGLAPVKLKKKWGFIDKKGVLVIPAIYQEVRANTGHLIAVKSGNRWGYINQNNNWIIKPTFDNAYNFTEGLARVEEKGLLGFIDETGNFVIAPQFDKAFPFINKLARIKKDGYWSYIDQSGKLLGNLKLLNAEDFSEGLARAATEKGWGYIFPAGEWAVQPQYYFAGNFSNGIGRVKVAPNAARTDKDDWIFIDKSNKKLFADQYFEKAEDFYNGTGRVKKKGLWGYINEKGEFVIQPQFELCLEFNALE